jgi:hypothetical protein
VEGSRREGAVAGWTLLTGAELSLGANVIWPDSGAALRTETTGFFGASAERVARSDCHSTGAPALFLMSCSFSWNGIGAGGGASRVTTVRETLVIEGFVTFLPLVETRIEAVVGRMGIGPRITGAEETSRMTLASRTIPLVTTRPPAKVSRRTMVTRDRFT